MSYRNSTVNSFYCIFSILACTSLARHAHRRPLHRHAARAELITTEISTTVTANFVDSAPANTIISAFTTANAPLPSTTAGSAVIDDILKIQTGLNGLPEDMLAFILALEQRLGKLEELLAGYTDGSGSPVGPVGPVLSPAPPTITQAPEITSIETSSPTSTRPATSLCRPLGGAGPLRLCDGPDVTALMTTRSTRITRTMTLMTTIAPALPIPTGTKSNNSFPAMNGSDFTPPAPWTKPYLVSDAFTSTSPSSAVYSSAQNFTATPASTAETTVPTASPYVFNAESEDNVAVYYGTTPATTEGGLVSLCSNPNVDIVILSFVFSFFDANGYPSIDFGPGCSSQTSIQENTAPGLKDCSALASEVSACQTMDKKVLLSLGGYNSNTSFASDTQATEFATTLWDLFGAGSGLDAGLRPFGTDVTVDGFDLDNENHSTEHYETFATALRERFTTDDSKTYYLSAAPQCPIPDESIPLGALQQADFVWVQFYNNPSCNIDSQDSSRASRPGRIYWAVERKCVDQDCTPE